MVKLHPRDFDGVWRVKYNNKHEFNVRCVVKDKINRESTAVSKKSFEKIRKNYSKDCASFVFIPKVDLKRKCQIKLPKWLSDTPDGIKKPIEVDQWGKPYVFLGIF